MISVEDYVTFVDEALDGMVEILSGLGDELANSRPDLPGANSPYVILTASGSWSTGPAMWSRGAPSYGTGRLSLSPPDRLRSS